MAATTAKVGLVLGWTLLCECMGDIPGIDCMTGCKDTEPSNGEDACATFALDSPRLGASVEQVNECVDKCD